MEKDKCFSVENDKCISVEKRNANKTGAQQNRPQVLRIVSMRLSESLEAYVGEGLCVKGILKIEDSHCALCTVSKVSLAYDRIFAGRKHTAQKTTTLLLFVGSTVNRVGTM